MDQSERKPYGSDVSDDAWALVAPSWTLMTEDAPQREYAVRAVCNGVRWVVRTGTQWRWLPQDVPPWPVVYHQTQRWLRAAVFADLVQDLRAVLRLADGHQEAPTAGILDGRTRQSSPESGARAG
jgi:transposase